MISARPVRRLRHTKPGDTVKLSGLPRPLFHGGYCGDYALLYQSETHYEDGMPWVSMVCLGVPAFVVEGGK